MMQFLTAEGYAGHTHDKPNGISGLGIFYKADKFDVVEHRVIDLDVEGRSYVLSVHLRWKQSDKQILNPEEEQVKTPAREIVFAETHLKAMP